MTGGVHGGGMHAWWRGHAWLGGMCDSGYSWQGGMQDSGGEGIHDRGVAWQGVWHARPPWTEFMTHACENITFPQLRCGW